MSYKIINDKHNMMLFHFMKEETGQRHRELTLPLAIFDPSKSYGSSFDTICRSVYNVNGNSNGSRKDGNIDDKKCAKARQLSKKVSF